MTCAIDTGEGPMFENTIIRGWEESGSRKNLSKIYRNNVPLKGLSHEIDFKNFDKNLQNLA
jgi:hypothetical protein